MALRAPRACMPTLSSRAAERPDGMREQLEEEVVARLEQRAELNLGLGVDELCVRVDRARTCMSEHWTGDIIINSVYLGM